MLTCKHSIKDFSAHSSDFVGTHSVGMTIDNHLGLSIHELVPILEETVFRYLNENE